MSRRVLTRCSQSLALIALLFSPGAARAQTIFTDDFSSGASALWGNQHGNWSGSSGVYNAQSPSNSPPTFSLLPFMFADFSIGVDINQIRDGGIWLRADVDPNSNSILNGVLLVTGANGGLYWHTITNGGYSSFLNPIGGLFVPGVSNARIRVDVIGNTYSAFVNNATTAATTLTTTQFASGLTGLYDFSGQTFDNVQIDIDNPVTTPEPASLALFATGLIALGLVRRRLSTRA